MHTPRGYTAARAILAILVLIGLYHRLAPDTGPALALVAAGAMAIGIYYLTDDDQEAP